MAINTITYSTKSNSYSKPNTPQKSGSASKTNAKPRSSTTSSVKATSSAPKRDTFTYSSQQRAFTEEIQSWNTLKDSGGKRCNYGTNIDVGGQYVTSGKSGY